jgi:hypothetical protein
MRSLEEVLEASRALTPKQVWWSNVFFVLSLIFFVVAVYATYQVGPGWFLVMVWSLLAAVLSFVYHLVVRMGRG